VSRVSITAAAATAAGGEVDDRQTRVALTAATRRAR